MIALSKDLAAAAASANDNELISDESSILLPSENQTTAVHFPRLSPSCPALDPKLNYRPVIGILSHPGDGASGRLNNEPNASYIAASYVKFVESAGARVIPLIYNEPLKVLEKVILHCHNFLPC